MLRGVGLASMGKTRMVLAYCYKHGDAHDPMKLGLWFNAYSLHSFTGDVATATRSLGVVLRESSLPILAWPSMWGKGRMSDIANDWSYI